jgi:hypothetical protein
MTEKQKLLENLVEKSGKTNEELNELISEKVNELSGLISEEGAIYIIANELGVRLDSERPKKEANLVKIDEVTEPKTPVSLNCKVLRKYDRVNFSSKKGGDGNVQSILVGDETGIIRIVFWNEKTQLLENVHEGDILKIINAYTRENPNQERIEIHYGQYSDIEVNPKGVEVEVKEFQPNTIEATEKKIPDIKEGERNIKLSGVITDFEIPRYYVGCPECFKKVFQDENTYKCAEHDEVEAIKIPIVNIVLDDGEATIGIVGFRDRAESMTGLKDKEIISLTEDIDKYRDFSKKIIGSKIDIVGNASLNNMTGEMQVIANQILNIEFKDIEEVAKELIEEDNSKSKEKTQKQEIKKETAKQEESQSSQDDDDLGEIEEIDIDDDLL